jgi:hypothetical protein
LRQDVSTNRDVEAGEIAVIPDWRTIGDEFVPKSGKQLLQGMGTASLRDVNVRTLRNAPSVPRLSGQNVAVHHCHTGIEVGQHTRRE